MRVVIGGSFNVYDEMKNLARRLEEVGIEAILPQHSKGMEDVNSMREYKQAILEGKVKLSEEDYRRIGEVESWFFKQIKSADYVVIYNKNVRNGKPVEGYIGINTAIDIGCAIGSGKEVILVFPPIDVGIRGLYSIGLIKVMSAEELVRYLEKRMGKFL
jgi:hypothetical protein